MGMQWGRHEGGGMEMRHLNTHWGVRHAGGIGDAVRGSGMRDAGWRCGMGRHGGCDLGMWHVGCGMGGMWHEGNGMGEWHAGYGMWDMACGMRHGGWAGERLGGWVVGWLGSRSVGRMGD